MPTSSLSRFDAALWSWASESEDDQLSSAFAATSRTANGKNMHVTFETVFVDAGHPFSFLEPRSAFLESEIERKNVRILKLVDADSPWLLAAFKSRHSGVYHLMSSLPTSHRRWEKVERWLASARGVSRCFLDHSDFESIGDRLSEFGDVEVVKMSGRVTKDGSSVNRGFPSLGADLRPNHINVIEEAESRGATVRTLTLHVRSVMDLHLRRIAGATYYSGDFSLFEELILTRLEDAAHKRRELLRDRQRRSRQPVRPITLYLEPKTLDTADSAQELLTTTDSMRDISIAVFHRNPYLHFAVTDEFDGSNFDVMVTDSDSIDIFPGYRASLDSLARVALRIGERFGATRIVDTPNIPVPSMSDLAEMGG
ncbi:hypothetical protein [Nocardia arizonensis]|uniref:hypothetical protein n=1 Tax=Nocardia arizonensis TaxID=1141647 RepID=UPI000A6A1176|nr:hypothetical protein [Nocardia arizonensis]